MLEKDPTGSLIHSSYTQYIIYDSPEKWSEKKKAGIFSS